MPEHTFRQVMSDRRLAGTARVVYFFARELSDKADGYCYAPVTEIAERTGISPDLCGVYITELVKAGYLTRESARGLGTGRRKLGIVGWTVTLLTAAAMGAATPQASGASLTQLRPAASEVPETVLSGPPAAIRSAAGLQATGYGGGA